MTDQLQGKASLNIPAGAAPLWRAFLELSMARSWHQFGPNPISYQEIEAWARLKRWPLQPHHIDALRAMDAALLEHFALKRATPPGGSKTVPQTSGHKLSPKLFDLALS
ncbi:phage tail assembly chaperone [Alkalilacustris brevis]|uniref:phage tail assembly chaperone n=1 Tax=Alkalilacustris brevis TaxID=2026338 RepID=UPI001390642B|nr:hypothetical protein [Alkalilacustris brevis]